MSVSTFSYTDVPDALLDLLVGHVPHSLPLLRCLQFTKLHGSGTPAPKILFASDNSIPPWEGAGGQVDAFTAAYLDLAAGPETQMWVYSTLEDNGLSEEEEDICSRQIESLVNEARRIGREYDGELAYPGRILIGSLHSSTQGIIERKGIKLDRRSTLGYDKWLFKARAVSGERICTSSSSQAFPKRERDVR
ncbi:uncharacterized protein DNG_05263 [Cephalotrichum gorgonifer]|uniref:Uncharacterized protein n=1 Tax=Cephalotrichum gorgonifer TaxID=2041049 RepID=A0AAE8N0E7_9PEZI|nr:uncharacterized protein DNG_05263 [Cephalotrichum gorgonifer]